MGVRSLRIYGPTSLPSSNTTLYTVPADHTLIIRSIRVTNTDSAVRNFSLYINGSGGADRVWQVQAQAAQTTLVENGWWALNPGDTLRGQASAASLLTIVVMGALLAGAV